MQYFLIKLLIALCVVILESDLLVREQHEVIDKNLSGFLQCVFRVNGTIRRYFNNEFVIVGLLLNTIWLNSVFHITDWGVNRIDRNDVDISAEFTVLICGHISASFVDSKINLH